jgi:hypothetical protein
VGKVEALPGEAHVAEATIGPAGLVLFGQKYRKAQREDLAESYKLHDHALTLLKVEDFRAWMSLVTPYLGDLADPSVVAGHRKRADQGPFSGDSS